MGYWYSHPMKREDIYYEAMLARDHRFDGKFFVGVRTTGIYCRPVCPARPKKENVEFFQNRLSAERAGYRPCLRCRPESAPESPAWIGTTAVVRRAIKVLHNQDTINFNENRFAGAFGVTARHLRRLFVEEIGKTPKQLSFENRLNLARKLLSETALPVTEVAFASGFNSIRRFNDAFRGRFTRSPTQIRRSRASGDRGLRVSLPYRPPFDFMGLLHFYQAHRIGNLERFEDGKVFRVIEFNDKVGTITVSDDPENSQVLCGIDFPDTSMIHAILARVRGMLDLDSDPVVIANSLELDPKMKALLKKHPGIRLPSGWDGFETAVSAMLGQLVSVAQGRALVCALIEMLGRDSGLSANGRAVKLFPSPGHIASSPLTGLGTTSVRKQTLIDFSRAVAEKKISLEPTQDVDEFTAKIREIRGIGPWTASYMAMKVLRHTDAFPGTDLILARALKLHPREVIEKISPWRGYAAVLLWREYAQTLKKTKEKKS